MQQDIEIIESAVNGQGEVALFVSPLDFEPIKMDITNEVVEIYFQETENRLKVKIAPEVAKVAALCGHALLIEFNGTIVVRDTMLPISEKILS